MHNNYCHNKRCINICSKEIAINYFQKFLCKTNFLDPDPDVAFSTLNLFEIYYKFLGDKHCEDLRDIWEVFTSLLASEFVEIRSKTISSMRGILINCNNYQLKLNLKYSLNSKIIIPILYHNFLLRKSMVFLYVNTFCI